MGHGADLLTTPLQLQPGSATTQHIQNDHAAVWQIYLLSSLLMSVVATVDIDTLYILLPLSLLFYYVLPNYHDYYDYCINDQYYNSCHCYIYKYVYIIHNRHMIYNRHISS